MFQKVSLSYYLWVIEFFKKRPVLPVSGHFYSKFLNAVLSLSSLCTIMIFMLDSSKAAFLEILFLKFGKELPPLGSDLNVPPAPPTQSRHYCCDMGLLLSL